MPSTNEPEPDLRPPVEGVWPPSPRGWEGAEGGVRIEPVEIEQGRDRLTLRNRLARRLLVFGGCTVPFVALLPLLLSLAFRVISPPHTAWAYVVFVYTQGGHEFLWQSLFECVCLTCLYWFIYDRHLHRGYFVLDKRGGAIRAGGSLFCLMSELGHVLIRKAQGKWLVYLVRTDGEKSPDWDASDVRVPGNARLVAGFSRKISAEDVAGIVAEFAGVPVRYQAGTKNSV